MEEWDLSAIDCDGPHLRALGQSPPHAAWMIWATSSGVQTGGSCSCQPAVSHLRAPAVREDQTGVQLFDCSGYPWWGWRTLEMSWIFVCFLICYCCTATHNILKEVSALAVDSFFSFLSLIDAEAVVAIVSVSPSHMVLNYSWSCVLYWFHGASHLPWRPYGTHSCTLSHSQPQGTKVNLGFILQHRVVQ